MRILAVYNIKGGVGKTASAVNLAWLSASAGLRTLLWDLDPQGAATYYLRGKAELRGSVKKLIRGKKPVGKFVRKTVHDGLDLLPSDLAYRHLDLVLDGTKKPVKRLARLLRPLARDYDHLYIDCAPSISLVSEGIFAAADALLVPTIPTPLSLRTLEQLADHLEGSGSRKTSVLPFFCMVDRRKSLHREICQSTKDARYPFLESRIPYSSVVERMGTQRAPVPTYAPTSDAAHAYEDLWREVLQRSGSWISRLTDARAIRSGKKRT